MGQEKAPARHFTVILGSNRCESIRGTVIKVAGPEGSLAEFINAEHDVERGGDGRLLVSFDARDEEGVMLVKVRRNKAVYVHPSLSEKRGPDSTEVAGPNGLVVSVRVHDDRTVEVNGDFHVGPVRVFATPDALMLGSLGFAHNTFRETMNGIVFGYSGVTVG